MNSAPIAAITSACAIRRAFHTIMVDDAVSDSAPAATGRGTWDCPRRLPGPGEGAVFHGPKVKASVAGRVLMIWAT